MKETETLADKMRNAEFWLYEAKGYIADDEDITNWLKLEEAHRLVVEVVEALYNDGRWDD